jgi:hypothetical protein
MPTKQCACCLLLWLLPLALSCFVRADLCEAECDSHPLRTHVGRVLQRSLGIDPASVTLETRFMVRADAGHTHERQPALPTLEQTAFLFGPACASRLRQGNIQTCSLRANV